MTEVKDGGGGGTRSFKRKADEEDEEGAAGKRRRRHVQDEPSPREAEFDPLPETKVPAATTTAARGKHSLTDAVGELALFLQSMGLQTKRARTSAADAATQPEREAEYEVMRDDPTYSIDLSRNAVYTHMGPRQRLEMPLPVRSNRLRLAEAQRMFSLPNASAVPGKLPRLQVKSLTLDQRYMGDLTRPETLGDVCRQFARVEEVKLFAGIPRPRPRLQAIFALTGLRRVHLHMRGAKSPEMAAGLVFDVARAATLRLLRILDVSEWCTLTSAQLDVLLDVFAEWPEENRPTVLSIAVKHDVAIWSRLFGTLTRLRTLRVLLTESESFDAAAFNVMCAESKAVAGTLSSLQIRTAAAVEGKSDVFDAARMTHLTRLHTLLVNREFGLASLRDRLIPALHGLERLEIGVFGGVNDKLITNHSSALLKTLTFLSSAESSVTEAKCVVWVRRHPMITRTPRGWLTPALTTTAVVQAMVKAWLRLEAITLHLPFSTQIAPVLELVQNQQADALTELILNGPDSPLISDDLLVHVLGDVSDESRALEVLDITGMIESWTKGFGRLAKRCSNLRRVFLTVPHVFRDTPVIEASKLLEPLLTYCPRLHNVSLRGPFVTGPADEWKAFLTKHERRQRPVSFVLEQIVPPTEDKQQAEETKQDVLPAASTVEAKQDVWSATETKRPTESKRGGAVGMDTSELDVAEAIPPEQPQLISIVIGMAGAADPNVAYSRALRDVFWLGPL